MNPVIYLSNYWWLIKPFRRGLQRKNQLTKRKQLIYTKNLRFCTKNTITILITSLTLVGFNV